MPREKKPTLKRRKDGRYRCVYKGIQFYGTTPEEAFAARDEYKASLNKGFARISVADYALPWLKRSYPKGTVADSTYTGLAIHLQHLIDIIGNKRISEIIPSDIKQIYAEQYAGLSNSYIRSAKQLFCALFDSAVADGLLRFNPARDKSAKPHRGNKPKDRILTKQERVYVETLCTDHRTWPAVMCMLWAGLRPQEVKALDIDRDVDFDHDIITVRTTAHIDGQKYAYNGKMKTDWSKRQVPLFQPLKQALKGRHGLVITSAHGKPVTLQTWKTAWNSYIFSMETAINGIQKRWYGIRKDQKEQKEAGTLPSWIDFDIVPYTLRHAFCSFCRDNEVDINTCRRWMGHADAKMILKVYDSVSSDREQSERKKIEKNWFQVRNEVQQKPEQPPNVDE
jgi:integrase